MGKGKRIRSKKNFTEKEELEARKLLRSDMDQGYCIALDDALRFTQIAIAKKDLPKDKYMEAVTRTLYYAGWEDCEKNRNRNKPTGIHANTQELINALAEFKNISVEKAEEIVVGDVGALSDFLKNCKNLGVTQSVEFEGKLETSAGHWKKRKKRLRNITEF